MYMLYYSMRLANAPIQCNHKTNIHFLIEIANHIFFKYNFTIAPG